MESKTLFEVLGRVVGLYFLGAALVSLPSLGGSMMPSTLWMGVLLQGAFGLVLLTRVDLVTRFAFKWGGVGHPNSDSSSRAGTPRASNPEA